MLKKLKQAFSRLSFSRQFLLAIVVVLLFGMLGIGSWIAHLIETNALNRTAAISAIYLESMSAAQLHDWPSGGIVDEDTHAELDRLFVEGPLHREVLRFKLWDASGRIDYSNDHEQIGLRFPVVGRLAAAFAGTMQTRISDLQEFDNQPENTRWAQMLEIYVPIRSTTTGKVFAVAEFYLSVENLRRDIRSAQQRSWVLVAASTVAIYLLLFGLVRRASNTIQEQQRDLRHQLQQLLALVGDRSGREGEVPTAAQLFRRCLSCRLTVDGEGIIALRQAGDLQLIPVQFVEDRR